MGRPRRIVQTAQTKVRAFIARWPGGKTTLARDLQVSYWTVASWENRGVIPAAWFELIIRSARKRGLHEITPERLARVVAKPLVYRTRRRRRPITLRTADQPTQAANTTFARPSQRSLHLQENNP